MNPTMFFSRKHRQATISLVLIVTLLSAPKALALVTDFGWAVRIGGNGGWYANIALDGSGNVYAAGGFGGTVDFDPGPGTYNLTSAGDSDIVVIKIDKDGNFVWAKQIGGSAIDSAHAIALDESENIYITGEFEGTVDFDPGPGVYNLTSAGEHDIFVSKLDSSGNFIWTKNMGGTGPKYGNFGALIALDGSRNVYTVGSFAGTVDFDPGPDTYTLTSIGGDNAFISKLDADGNFQWVNRIGDSFYETITAIVVDESGNILVPGGTGTFDGIEDYTLNKLDTNGNFLWTKQMDFIPRDFVEDANGNIYVTGCFVGTVDLDPGPGAYNLTSAGDYDIFISKLDADGNLHWARSLGGAGYDDSWGIAMDENSNVYMTGFFQNTVDFDPGPGIHNLTSAGEYDIFVSKLDRSGNFTWAKSMGGFGSENWGMSFTIALDGGGNIYTAGIFEGTIDFDPGPGVYNLISVGWGESFISKLVENKSNFEVNTAADTDDGYCDLPGQGYGNQDCTLREAINAANADSDASEISFADNYTITLAGSQLPALNTEITITGNGAGNTIIQAEASPGTATHRVFEVSSTGIVTLDSLTVQNGNGSDISGAGIYNNGGTLTVANSVISNNSAESGGGIYNFGGALTVTNSTFSGNSASSAGGGIYNHDSSPVLKNVTFSENSASAGGGMYNYTGIFSFNSAPALTNVTFNHNTVTSDGGGMYNSASDPLLKNVTFMDNTATGNGGGIYNWGDSNLTAYNLILWGNNASDGPQIRNFVDLDSIIFISDSIVQGDYPGGVNIIDADPLLGDFTDYGNPGEQVFPLLPGSPAIDSGNDAYCPATDQRGVDRPQGSHCDVGAFEYIPDPSVCFDLTLSSGPNGGDPTASPTKSNGCDAGKYVAGAHITLTAHPESDYQVASWSGSDDDTSKTATNALTMPATGTSATVSYEPIDRIPPFVSGITLIDLNPTSAASAEFKVTFSESVNNVDVSDFTFTKTGSITGYSITNLTPTNGPADTYIVTVNIGSYNGTLRLDVLNNGSIMDSTGNPLASGYSSGPAYNVTKTHTTTLPSQASYDGYMLESSETSGNGGTKNNRGKLLYVGDDASNKQYRSILAFNTSGIPDNAVITKVTLRMKRSGVAGSGNPIKTFRGFMVDVRQGTFGTTKLALGDFQKKYTTGYKTYGPFKPALSGGWYNLDLTSGKDYLNRIGNTQIRLRFKLDDNNNSVANYLKLYSGNAGTAASPQLVVEYYVP